ncbi:hypothetical protein JQM64_08535 [Fournierella massiliensis]|nr:hypothetical protein [Fournierella massiliensis]
MQDQLAPCLDADEERLRGLLGSSPALALLAIDLFMPIWPFLPSKKNKKSETPTV